MGTWRRSIDCVARHRVAEITDSPAPVRQYGRPPFLDASVIADQHGALWVVPSIGHVGGASWAHRQPYDGPREDLADPLDLDEGTRAALVHGPYCDVELDPKHW